MPECLAVSLARYAERVGYCQCSFWGVNSPDCEHYECQDIWTLAQRNEIADYLASAQGLIEGELGYPLCVKWFTDERHSWTTPFFTRWGHVIAGGVQLVTTVQAGAAVVVGTDPATVTVATTVDPEDLHVYFAGTDQEITPLSKVTSGGNVVFTIPWCRLVDPAYQDNDASGLPYSAHATWMATTVDVKSITNSTSTQAKLIVPPGVCCNTACAETEYDACMYVRLPELGSVEVSRATYADGVWTRTSLCVTARPTMVDVNYCAGLTELPSGVEDAIIRLAHSLMPTEPCGCSVLQRLWSRDRNVPLVLTRERINCDFGLNDGAWFAWMWARRHKMVRGSIL